MSVFEKIIARSVAPKLTRARVIAAIVVAVVADALQFIQLPVFVEVVDVAAMALTIWLLGFHLLLLPTFAVEFIPVIDMLPTWTGCVIAVIVLRKREQKDSPAPPQNHGTLPR